MAIGLVSVGALNGCADSTEGDDVPTGECVGASSGDVTLLASGGGQPLPGGGQARFGSAETGEDPPRLRLVLGDAERDDPDQNDLTVDDSFALRGATYSVVGFCEDKAWLDESSG